MVLGLQVWLGLSAVLFLAVVEFLFFKEFNARFNLVAVDYLIYPHEVFGNIAESYHVVPVALTVAVIAATPLIAIWQWVMTAPVPQQRLLHRTFASLFLGAAALLATVRRAAA